jgi:hypothetical protein
MLSLSTTAGDFALSIVERCSTLQVLPPNLDDAVKRLERYARRPVFNNTQQLELTFAPQSRLRAIALRCQELSEKSFISCFFQNTAFKGELDELRGSLDTAIQEFQVIVPSICSSCIDLINLIVRARI